MEMDCESIQDIYIANRRRILCSKHIEAYVLQVIILANHMNGTDTHVRGLKILGPEECVPCVPIECLR